MVADLREFIELADRAGELTTVRGADWDLEIGAITELVAEKGGGLGGAAVVFDDIEGYPEGYRILANTFGSVERSRIALNREETDPIDIVDGWRRDYADHEPVDPEVVPEDEAPVLENVATGDDVDVYEFPTPKWHDVDGGRYIGTGSTVITRDPDTGWVNLGVYRSMLLDDSTVSLLVAQGKDADVMLKQYHERGEPCPVALVAGPDPHTWVASTYTARRQEGEYGLAGWIRGEPTPVIEGPVTGLPIPAAAEVVLEGFIPPTDERSCEEGPFGEWVGYATPRTTGQPVIEVEAVLHRDDPILLGQPPLKPPAPYSVGIPIRTAGGVWTQLENAGVPGVKGVWSHVFERPMFLVIAIEQEYPGHAKQVAAAAMSVPNGAYGGRYVVVVDHDDVDLTNLEDVLWAVCSRCPAEDIDVVDDVYTSPADPVIPDKSDPRSSRVLIDATRPFDGSYPVVNQFDREYRDAIAAEWGLDDPRFSA